MAHDGGRLLHLTSGPLALALAPAAGGSVARFDHCAEGARRPVLRGCPGVPRRILEAACFPLVPYVNRIRGGGFRFRGKEIRIAPNMTGEANPLHGQGWLSAWRVERHRDDEAELRFRHDPGEWPWAYEAGQLFRLDDGGLDMALSCRNLSAEPMPCGLGFHPYFPCEADTRIDTDARFAWTVDEAILPLTRVPAEGRYRLAGRPVCGQGLDNGFEGWSGQARITGPDRPFAIELTAPDVRFFQLYSPKDGQVFVAEPVSHRNAALNEPEEDWDEAGLRVLAPGEEMTLRARIAIIPG